MLDLKKLLTKILQNLHTIPYCHARGIASDLKSVTTGTWYNLNQFGGSSNAQYNTDSSYFGESPNGIVIKKKGVYRLDVNVHFVASATNTAFGVRFYNYTASTQIGDSRFAQNGTFVWADVSNMHYVNITSVPTTIIPQFERQGGSGTIRPNVVAFTAMLLKDG